MPCESKGKVFHVKFHVIEIEAPSVLRAQTCKEMGLLAKVHSLQQHDIPERPTDLDQSIFDEYVRKNHVRSKSSPCSSSSKESSRVPQRKDQR